MPEPKLISPLLDGFVIGEPMSDHHGVCCCPALREDTGERHIVKIISIPASQVQLDALLLTGAFSAHSQALSYFEELAKGVLAEAETLGQLTKLEGFLPYTGSQLIKMSDGIGYEVYLVSPYKRSLRKQMQLAPLTHLGAVNLGLDLCSALAASRRAGFLYIDLKPSNIFLTQTQGWRIGDLGFISLDSLKYASLPEKYRSEYTAPEISDAMSELNDTIDIYALGLVLYQVYNNGQLPFEGTAPQDPLPPPLYADYELAEIILKACNPNPTKRWTDPAQMGQALVDYMQRNSINDTPIVPPPIEVPPEPEEDETEEFLNESENEATLEELMQSLLDEEEPIDQQEADFVEPSEEDEELSFIVDSTVDETVPSDESVVDLENALVTKEVAQMLAQADELISHELPEPAVAPDPIEVPFPTPIYLDAEENNTDPDSDTVEADEQNSEFDGEEDNDENEEVIDVPIETDESSDASSTQEYEKGTEQGILQNSLSENQEKPTGKHPKGRERKKRRSKFSFKVLIWIAVTLILLGSAGFVATFYYRTYYQQNIDNIAIDGDVDSFTVKITSDIDDNLLNVICTDTYGNARASNVTDGMAQFSNLTPNTQYRIQVKISGHHQLTGTTSGSYTTPAQTEIINFNASVGPEDGSVILSFTVNGPEPESWTVLYSTSNEPEQSVSFSGHSQTITGLTINSEYEFTLKADGEQYLTGNRELTFTSQKILYAQDLHPTACGDGSISAAWTIPEGSPNQNWIVRCYSDAGFDETITTSETVAQFNVPTHECSYTVEVTAEGMPSSASITVSANPITITEVIEEVSQKGVLHLTWNFAGNVPTGGWILSYSIDNTAAISINCDSNSVQIPYYPGSHYDVDIRPADEVTFLSEPFSYDAKAALAFENYQITAEDLSFYMCLTPNKENWDRFDVPAEDYRKEFKVGENASFLVEVWSEYKKSDEQVYISYIIRDKDGAPVSHDVESFIWNDMWEKRFCELDIPRLPAVTGRYTVEIYFNGRHVHTQKFKVT